MRYRPFLCAITLVAAGLLARPFVEMGICDDFSYIRTAKYLAETGHLDYFGWASPMLGWQLLIGAAFVKIFGFSFTVVRASVFCIAVATTILLYLTFIRTGLRERNALAATMVIVLSPLYLPLAFSYMTDVAGLFGIVLCLYCCLRAVQADQDPSVLYWLVAAAVSNVITGTARQTTWLGVLVVVPSTFWLIRRRVPIPAAIAVWLVCVASVFGSMRWLRYQPHWLPESLIDGPVNMEMLHRSAVGGTRFSLDLLLFLLPVLIAFFTGFVLRRRRPLFAILAIVAGIGLLFALGLQHSHREALITWLAPFTSDFVTERGMIDIPDLGNRPIVLSPFVRLIVTLVSLTANFAFLVFLLDLVLAKKTRIDTKVGEPIVSEPLSLTTQSMSWLQLAVLLIPFSFAYIAMLTQRALFGSLLDRYLLPLFIVTLIVCIRIYQENIRRDLPAVTFVCIAIFTAYGIAGTHDRFAMQRARLTAANRLLAAGIPSASFYGGFEYDGWTQIEQWGFVNANKLKLSPTDPPRIRTLAVKPCGYNSARLFIAIKPRYALSFSPDTCDGPSQFAPVSYRTWLPPFTAAIYIQRVQASADTRAEFHTDAGR